MFVINTHIKIIQQTKDNFYGPLQGHIKMQQNISKRKFIKPVFPSVKRDTHEAKHQ